MKWAIQLPTGEFLDTPLDLDLQFEFNNQVFSTSDTALLPGSYSFPIEVPLTARMKTLFGFPDRVDRATLFQNIENVWVYAGGIRLFSGTLKILKARKGSVSISIFADFLGSLKKANLADIDFGANVAAGGTSSAAWAAHMKDTAENPEDYNHIFFPVYFTGGNTGWVNKWNAGTGTFDIAGTNAVAPFVKISYILDRIFSAADGYSIINDWQTDIEMFRRYLFHQADVRVLGVNPAVAPTFPADYPLKDHVPQSTIPKFLRSLCAQNCLGIFTNPFNRTIRIGPLQSAITNSAIQDWTTYALYDPIIEPDTANIGYLNYAQPYDGVPDNFPPVETVEVVYNTRDDFNLDWQNLPTGFAYIEAGETMMEVRDEGAVVTFQRGHPLFRGVGVASETGIIPELVPFRAIEFGNEGVYYIFHEGEASVYDNGSGSYAWQQKTCPLTVLQFRGIQVQKSGQPASPLACNSVWKSYNTGGVRSKIVAGGVDLADSTHSLNYLGEYGLGTQAWGAWFEMLKNGKHVTQSFILPITTLTGFSFGDKIRVGNMDFFAKKIRVQKLLDRGRVLVEANMVSVI